LIGNANLTSGVLIGVVFGTTVKPDHLAFVENIELIKIA
jgi:hypothetical protein